jgi:Recombination endonuclease VII
VLHRCRSTDGCPLVVVEMTEAQRDLSGQSWRKCKDCKTEGRTGKPLDARYPGPRCLKHHRVFRKAQSERAAAKRRASAYGITPEQYEALLAVQGGGCGWCGRRPYKGGRRLAVDHDHACCPGKTSCGYCIRGLLCWSCNKHLQHLGDDSEMVLRGYRYLEDPPASLALASSNV